MKKYTNEDIERMSASIDRNEYNGEGEETEEMEDVNENGTRLVRNKLVPKRSQSASISRPSNRSNNNSNSTSSGSSRRTATSKPDRKLSEDEMKYGDDNAGQITTIKKYKETHRNPEVDDGEVGVRQLTRKKLSNKRSSSAIVGGNGGRGRTAPEKSRNLHQYVDKEMRMMDQDVGERAHALETMFKSPSISLSTTTESSSRSTNRQS